MALPLSLLALSALAAIFAHFDHISLVCLHRINVICFRYQTHSSVCAATCVLRSSVSSLNWVAFFNIQPAWLELTEDPIYGDLVTKNFEFCNFSPKYTQSQNISRPYLCHADHTDAAHFRKSFRKHLNEICYWYWPILLHTNWIWPFLCRVWANT